jgi:hypothetical protein
VLEANASNYCIVGILLWAGVDRCWMALPVTVVERTKFDIDFLANACPWR